tara:strand:+ start:286 stop:516 length:231 start_codon:yes stop_codon:yes gene_type:complete
MSDEEILDIAFENSYKVLILDYDWEEIMSETHPFIAHNPARSHASKEDVKRILNYFERTEQYRKCQSIQNYLTERL